MQLDDLHGWYARLRAELDVARFEVGWQGPEPGRAKASVCLSVDGPERLGELVVWETGEAQLQLGDVAGGLVTDERMWLADAEQLATAVGRMTAWVVGGA
ncbi:hypothetical protein FE633_12240 [Streptomyces montanus]|uniref:Uncharacterized protein n=1 Tax=Streptomyces montanus TaxID=2580423 RepID=A0A5R9FVH1_9ACTN|nr:hypothetical protein [Streptomyces montanus]TLS45920.1 hypothetical protein FE633_12240 [Streptomyces montanus]